MNENIDCYLYSYGLVHKFDLGQSFILDRRVLTIRKLKAIALIVLHIISIISCSTAFVNYFNGRDFKLNANVIKLFGECKQFLLLMSTVESILVLRVIHIFGYSQQK